jgi:gliding motility-associated-like protein
MFCYLGNDYKEHVQAELVAPLTAGQEYIVEFDLVTDGGAGISDGMGVWFTDQKVNINTMNGGNRHIGPGSTINASPVWEQPAGVSLPVGCTHVSFTFCATGSESWIVFGNFRTIANTTLTNGGQWFQASFYWLDNVLVSETCGTAAPLDLSASNTSIPCQGSTDLTASGGSGTYDWIPNIGTGSGPITVLPTATMEYSVVSLIQNGCGTYSDTASIVINVAPCGIDIILENDTICSGECVDLIPQITGAQQGTYSVLWDDPPNSITEMINVCPTSNTDYIITVTDQNGATYADTVHIEVLPVSNTVEILSTCENSTVTYPDGTNEVITSNVSHTSNLTSVNGCDSIIVTNVTMNAIILITENIQVCSGSDYTYPDGSLSANIIADENHTSDFMNSVGCDSSIVTNLTVVSAFSITENQDICPGSDYTFPDGTMSTNIQVNEMNVSTIMSSGGCDSIVTTNLTVSQVYNLSETVSVCENSSLTYPDGSTEIITASTSHTSNLISSVGCDSVIVTMVNMTPLFNSSEMILVCENNTVTYPDGTTEVITGNTSYTSNLISVAGCDSIITTNVTMNPSYSFTTLDTICEGADYTFPDGTIMMNTASDVIHVSSFVSINNCDSLLTTELTVLQLPIVYAGADTIVCEQEPVVLLGSGNAISYTWNNGITNGVPFTPVGVETYTVTGISSFGCLNNDDVEVGSVSIPDVNFTADTLYGCSPLEVNFTNLSNVNGVNCQWLFGDGGTGVGCQTVNHIYNEEGVFDVTLTITNDYNCSVSLTIDDYIQTFAPPVAAFSPINLEIDFFDTSVEFTNESTNATSYEWLFGDGAASSEVNPDHMFPEDANTSYTVMLIASDQSFGCADTAYGYINVEDVIIFYVPNAFTPDGDEHNQIFQPVFSSGFDPYDFHLLLLNRWGQVIFESYDAQVGWDGTYDGKIAQDGIYTWKIDFKETMSDRRHVKVGHVNLLR